MAKIIIIEVNRVKEHDLWTLLFNFCIIILFFHFFFDL